MIWMFSQVGEGFDHRQLAWMENYSQTCPLTRENVVIPTAPWRRWDSVRTPSLGYPEAFRVAPSAPNDQGGEDDHDWRAVEELMRLEFDNPDGADAPAHPNDTFHRLGVT